MFAEVIWPYLKKYIGIPITKQTLDSLYCIIQVHSRYPKLINGAFIPRVMETGTELLCNESMNDIAKILIFVSYIYKIVLMYHYLPNYFGYMFSMFLLWKYLNIQRMNLLLLL